MATLSSRNDYEICFYCGWEDELILPDDYSPANGATIRQYIVNQLGKAHNQKKPT
jgi:hypothetical protein